MYPHCRRLSSVASLYISCDRRMIVVHLDIDGPSHVANQLSLEALLDGQRNDGNVIERDQYKESNENNTFGVNQLLSRA